MDTSSKKILVLIVDDHQEAAQMLGYYFKSRDYEVAYAYQGKDALAYAQKHVPDLILLDIMMPGMNGFQVLETLRQDPRTRDIPTILVTAMANRQQSLEQGLALGADDFIAKPVEPRELLARAKSKVEAYRLRRDLSQKTRDLEVMLRLGEELSRHFKVPELLELVLYLTLDLLPGYLAVIYQLDAEGNVRHHLSSDKAGVRRVDLILSETMVNTILTSTGALRWQSDVHQIRDDLPCGMATKLMFGEQLQGILLILAESAYDDHHQRLFEGIAHQAGLALHNANYMENLEEIVAERTQKLRSAQNSLVQSEKMASLGRLAGNIAHEIRNPLLPITLNLEMMREDVQANTMPDMRQIETSLERAGFIQRIVETLLRFVGRQHSDTLDVEMLHVETLLNDLVLFVHKLFEQDRIEITTQFTPYPYVYGNRDQLNQVFLNLLINAKEAMLNGGKLTLQSVVENDSVVIRVIDTGIGIPEEIMGQIFEPLFSTKENGTGLGLYISYEIIQNHNGSIGVESKVGSGTVFTVKLPAIPESVDLPRTE